MIGKLTGIELEATNDFVPINEEDIEESLENLNMLLAV